jgi:tetratricopeptide (TPR) repeat protein
MSRSNPIADRLTSPVADFTAGHFVLSEELNRLQSVSEVGAMEATVFYAARILEALAAEALRRVGLKPHENLYANQVVLEMFDLLPTATRYWSHALRRLGNQVRHIQARIGPDDATVAALLAERCLQWYFCVFPHGTILPRLTNDEGPLFADLPEPLVALWQTVERWAVDPKAPLPEAALDEEGLFHATSALPALVAEVLINRDNLPGAERLLDRALKHFGIHEAVRLSQLKCLVLSRRGDLDEARERLERLRRQFPSEEETAGILGGVFKRLWQRDGRRHDLVRCHRAYQSGWEQSKFGNAYLGINVASTALWLGQTDEARQSAETVRQLLRDRASDYRAHTREKDFAYSFWDEMTLAEAELVAGDLSAARIAYRHAFERHSGAQQGNVPVCRKQLGELLQALGITLTVEEFLSQSDSPAP